MEMVVNRNWIPCEAMVSETTSNRTPRQIAAEMFGAEQGVVESCWAVMRECGRYEEVSISSDGRRNRSGRIGNRQPEQTRIYTRGDLGDIIPRMMLLCVFTDLPPAVIQFAVEITLEIPLDGFREIDRIFRPAHESCFALDDFVLQRSDVRRNHRQAEALSQEQDAALIDVPVGQSKKIRSLEIDFRFVIRDMIRVE